MSDSAILNSHQFGSQLTHLEQDIVYMKLSGRVSLEEARLINEVHLQYAKEVEYFFYLIDLSDLEDLPASVRKEASEVVKLLPLRGTVVINAPLRAKVLAKLLLTAANLFRKGQQSNPLMFADSEDEGRAIIDKQRRYMTEAVA